MATSARFTTQYNMEVFAESAPGVFSHRVPPAKTAVELESSGDTMTAVAIGSEAGQGVPKWSVWRNATTSPDGPVLKVQGSATSPANQPDYAVSGSYGCRVTVTDAGTHLGTPSQEKRWIVPGDSAATRGIVAVMHTAAPDGKVFTGWRVTRRPYLIGYKMEYVETLSAAAGEADGFATTYSAEALGASALVLAIPRSVDSPYDELVVEAVYVDAPTFCTVSFEPNAADATAPAIPDVKVGFGASARLPTPALWTRTGWAFDGWNTAADGSGEAYAANDLYSPAEGTYEITMYAQWAKLGGSGVQGRRSEYSDEHTHEETWWPYVISLSASGVDGTLTVACQTRTQMGRRDYRVNNDNGAVLEDVTEPQGGTVDATAEVPGQVNVPATQFILWDYTSTYNFSSGSPNGTTQKHRWHAWTDPGWTWTAPEVEGLEFVGWYTAQPGDAEDRTLLVHRDRTVTWDVLSGGLTCIDYVNYLHLAYRGRPVAVRLDACGGEVDPWRVEVRHGQAYGGLPAPAWSGHTFIGWFTSAEGGEPVTAETVVAAKADHWLYARWSRDSVESVVVFEPCGGETPTERKTVTSGQPYGELPTPTRGGWTFLGWFTASLGGTLVTEETVVGATFTHWLYAQWRRDESEGGGSAGLVEVTIGQGLDNGKGDMDT